MRCSSRMSAGALLSIGLVGFFPTAGASQQDHAQKDRKKTGEQKTIADREKTQLLNSMKRRAAEYEMYLGTDRKTKLSLLPEPVLRWANPVSGVKDGTVFLWTAADRPVIASSIFSYMPSRPVWIDQFQSLSESPLIAERRRRVVWYPSQAGIELKPLLDVPPPAKSAPLRLRQMRAMARDFTASVNWEGRSHYELRLLSRPLYRYGKPDTEVVDGTLFTFAQGTNPEVLLLLEAHRGKTNLEWQYALAPMTSYAVEAKYKGTRVWVLPARSHGVPNKPWVCLHFRE